MEPLLDNLTLAPGAQLFELDPPHYTSSYGRRTEAIFKHNVPPAPMLIAPDNGLVLYERVISTKAEHQMLDKLTKPKYYHPTPSIRKGGKGGSLGTAPSSGSGSSGTHSKNAARRPSSGSSAQHQSSGSRSAGPSSSTAEPDSRSAGGVSTTAPLGRETGQHRTRSFSAGRALPSTAGHVKRKPLYPEDGPLKDYFSKERASVTATTVFTWGNRYKIGDCGTGRGVTGGGSTIGIAGRGSGDADRAAFTSYTPMQQKPPLRL
ncbi:hypothetical protein Vafri_6721 [Volvox africanus]|uniref:Uncharacterized protein n=1 Tax=Volvox africanus TaxID=51714 RepID=A0A8J4AZA4_9CHLO|nr:hypothetical protein Vafri_6721 [Volvox africanus]